MEICSPEPHKKSKVNAQQVHVYKSDEWKGTKPYAVELSRQTLTRDDTNARVIRS